MLDRWKCLLLAGSFAAAIPGVAGCDSSTEPPVQFPPAGGAVNTAANEQGQPLPPMWLSSDDVAAGWIRLFDGESLFGWEANNGVNWSVQDGVITADSGDPGLLLTTVRYRDFELKCDYRLEAGGNSGIFLRTVQVPKDPAVDCYELNMCDSHPAFPTGSLVARKKVDQKIAGEGEWKTFYVKAEGRRIVAELDGQPVLDFTDDSEHPCDVGYLGLQKNAGKIEFRNVALRPLSTKPLFNDKDLDGWNVVPGSRAKFRVQEGTIVVDGGPGFLESAETYGNFLLQFQARTNARNVNSGVFFRALPGTEDNPSGGYELQIHNGFAEGDRTRPNDYGTGFGTGAVFRLAKAKFVAANDLDWFTMTLVADGNRFASFVNGYQVADFADTRKPDENPRRGQRLEAGHLSLQGHDAATQAAFRNLFVSELD